MADRLQALLLFSLGSSHGAVHAQLSLLTHLRVLVLNCIGVCGRSGAADSFAISALWLSLSPPSDGPALEGRLPLIARLVVVLARCIACACCRWSCSPARTTAACWRLSLLPTFRSLELTLRGKQSDACAWPANGLVLPPNLLRCIS
jgi:hypothetical protein